MVIVNEKKTILRQVCKGILESVYGFHTVLGIIKAQTFTKCVVNVSKLMSMRFAAQ